MRRAVIVLLAGLVTLGCVLPAGAQLRQRIENNMVDSAAKTLVSEIQTDSCSEFSSMLKSRKSAGSSGSKANGMLKRDPGARARFVNQVAGPLVNKMIDCDLLPGH